MSRFSFDIGSPLMLPLTVPLTVSGLAGRLARVDVEDGILDVRFGLLHLRTPVSNVSDVTVTGRSRLWKTLGARVSLRDRGLTFGTSDRNGVCIRFVRAVSGVLPIPLLAHPGLTVTVTEPERLRDTLLHERELALAEVGRLVAENDPLTRQASSPADHEVAARRLAGNLPDPEQQP